MLRTRKKDVRIKPNRKLDKRSSRSMLFENEELRLRTMEINAEVERGQTNIKKLRRENDHLRREMWALRDEYERLEALIKNLDLATPPGAVSEERPQFDAANYADQVRGPDANHRGNGANVEADGNNAHLAANVYVEAIDLCNADMDNIENYQKAYGRMPRRCSSAGIRTTWLRSANKADSLNINEEDEDGYTACSLLHTDITKQIVTGDVLPREKGSMSDSRENLALRQIGSSPPTLPAGQAPTCTERQTTDYLVTGACETVTEEVLSPAQRSLEAKSEHQCASKAKVKLPTVVVSLPQDDADVQVAKEPTNASISNVQIHQDNSLHYEEADDVDSVATTIPVTKTIMFDLAEHAALRNISVQTIIDELEQHMNSELSTIRGVRIVGTLVHISLDEQASILRATGQELNILGHKVHLVNLSEDSVFLILSGVPHFVSDNLVLTLVSPYGTTMGEVERRSYKGIDTGERLVRLHLKKDAQIPRYFTVEGCRMLVRVLGFDYSSLPSAENGFEADSRSTCDATIDNKPKIAKSFKYRSQLSIDLQAQPTEADDKSHLHITPLATDPAECSVTRPRLPSVNFGLGVQLPDASPPKPQEISRRKKQSSNGILRRSFFGANTDEEEPVLPKSEQRRVTSTSVRHCQVSQRETRFSLFSRRQRRKGVVQMSNSCDNLSEETLDDSFTSRGIRRDSERSTESTRSSLRRFEKLPWCGCWGNGCL